LIRCNTSPSFPVSGCGGGSSGGGGAGGEEDLVAAASVILILFAVGIKRVDIIL